MINNGPIVERRSGTGDQVWKGNDQSAMEELGHGRSNANLAA